MTIDRLFVLWADRDGRRRVIGHLVRTPDRIRFWYDARAVDSLAEGFVALPGLDGLREHCDDAHAFDARYLFATFAERIPSKARTDAAAMLKAWGVERDDDQFEILAKSGGARATDRIELAEYRADDDELAQPLEFRIAGGKHSEPAMLHAGEAVELRREPTNERDASATIVIARTGQRAGYVPAQYAKMFARLIDGGVQLDATAVRQLMLLDEAGRWVIRARRA